jgi:hypothetical protein
MPVFYAELCPTNVDAFQDDEPRAIQIAISPEVFERLRALSAIAAQVGLREVLTSDNLTCGGQCLAWLEEMPDDDPTNKESTYAMELHTLHVNATEFWYTARIVQSGVEVESAHLLIEKLAPSQPIDECCGAPAEENCTHDWVFTGTAYGGDDESYRGEGRCYCPLCGADGDA